MREHAPWYAAALIGTDRSDWPDKDALPPPLAGVYDNLQIRPLHEALPLLIGMAGLYAAAGQLAEKVTSTEWYLPAFRPESDRPVCSPQAARYLEQILNQKHTDLLPELLSLINDRQLRVTNDLLPHLMEYGAKTPRMRPVILPVIGERGQWLASMNPAWLYASMDLSDWRSIRHIWDSDRAGRGTLATYLRRYQPENTRYLIESTWRDEPDAMRRELLRAMDTGLSDADEPFLERALDDRDAQVRRKVVDLLAQLPNSRLIQRITRSAGNWLMWQGNDLVPNLPRAIDDQLVRDGVTQPTNSSLSPNDRSRLLMQALSVIPPVHWEERFQVAPETLIAAALRGKWPRTLMTAFSVAAARHGDRRWAEALLLADNMSERTHPILSLIPQEVLNTQLRQHVTSGHDMAVIVLMRHWPHPWNEESSGLVIDFITQQAAHETDTRFAPTVRYLAREFARRCSPTVAGYAERRFKALVDGNKKINQAWELSLKTLTSKLNYRLAFHRAMDD